MSELVWVINSGSSSIKSALYPRDWDRPTIRIAVTGIGNRLRLDVEERSGHTVDNSFAGKGDHAHALQALIAAGERAVEGHTLSAAGHRIVHGGTEFAEPVLLSADTMAKLKRLSPLAPLHQPYNLAAVDAIADWQPRLPQIGCFDTAFHRTQPRLATLFALPRALSEEGIRRYGFHGLSYEYISGILPEHLGPIADGKVVVAHLGHGASMCAMLGRKSVATTMGFTALDGLMMGRRCGTIDPGVILYLMQEKKMTPEAVSDLLYDRSGLAGVSGVSDDMRELLASSAPHPREAVELFVYRAIRELGSLASALGGIDALVFTGGIGEHAAEIRRRICEGAAWLGADLDAEANGRDGPVIGSEGSKLALLAIPTDEDLVIARHTRAILRALALTQVPEPHNEKA